MAKFRQIWSHCQKAHLRYLELTWVGKVHSRTPEIQKISVHCSMENEHYSFYLRDLTALNGSCLQFQQTHFTL